jgi:RNA polymerase sigma-70 factor (ECF subfamily)
MSGSSTVEQLQEAREAEELGRGARSNLPSGRLEALSSRAFSEFRVPEVDREDLRQDVLLALVSNRREVVDPEAWFLASLRNRCRKYWREEARRAQGQADAARPLAMVHRPRSISGAVDIRALISTLKPAQARLVVGRLFEGRSYEELSRLLGPTAESLRRILVRTLKRLRLLAGTARGRDETAER